MGVPSLFRWYEKRFPGVVRKPVDPNYDKRSKRDECDNLYVDANSIVHNACHPTDKAAPATEDDMLLDIARYLDHVIKTANPKKLIFIAIDGVAPQAKINQQRARRFRAAQESALMIERRQEFLRIARETGHEQYNLLGQGNDWDSNTITPGTPFMAKLDHFMHARIFRKFKDDPYYANIAIVFSGSNVPGEGEHKAMDFIRRQRQQPDYVPCRHAFYGPDADLIMLALATHEPDFRIIREDPKDKRDQRCGRCFEFGHSDKVCQTMPHDWLHPMSREEEKKEWSLPKLIFFDVYLLRLALSPYLEIRGPKCPGGTKCPGGSCPTEQDCPNDSKFQNNLDRAIDDFILLVTLLGNDFLPGLPLPDFEIHLGAINKVVDCWKRAVLAKEGYIVSKGTVRLDRLRQLFRELVSLEGNPPERDERDTKFEASVEPKYSVTPQPRSESVLSTNAAKMFRNSQRTQVRTDAMADLLAGGLEVADDEEKHVKMSVDADGNEVREYDNEQDLELFHDKKKFYVAKFGDRGTSSSFIRQLAHDYVIGLTWVMGYYCHGVPSWSWFYPYYYAPYPSDTNGIDSTVKTNWTAETLGKAMLPFYQLMSVFPPSSASHIPPPFRSFMLDKASPIRDFYPDSWDIDRNGKKQEWKSILKLPFVDNTRLVHTLKPVWDDQTKWTSEEKARNATGFAKLMVSNKHPLFKELYKFAVTPNDPRRPELAVKRTANENHQQTRSELQGRAAKDPQFRQTLAANEINNVAETPAVSVNFINPRYIATFEYWKLLPNQPPVERDYRALARIKRPEGRSARADRKWKVGENAGRNARDIAEERASGIKANHKDWLKQIQDDDSDEEEDEEMVKLAEDFEGFLLPIFREPRGDVAPVVDGWDDEDTDEKIGGPDEGQGGDDDEDSDRWLILNMERGDLPDDHHSIFNRSTIAGPSNGMLNGHGATNGGGASNVHGPYNSSSHMAIDGRSANGGNSWQSEPYNGRTHEQGWRGAAGTHYDGRSPYDGWSTYDSGRRNQARHSADTASEPKQEPDPEPEFNSYGYRAFKKPVRVKDEDDDEDPFANGSSDDEGKRKRKTGKKSKVTRNA